MAAGEFGEDLFSFGQIRY